MNQKVVDHLLRKNRSRAFSSRFAVLAGALVSMLSCRPAAGQGYVLFDTNSFVGPGGGSLIWSSGWTSNLFTGVTNPSAGAGLSVWPTNFVGGSFSNFTGLLTNISFQIISWDSAAIATQPGYAWNWSPSPWPQPPVLPPVWRPLQLSPLGQQRGHLGVPVEFEAVASIATVNSPVSVEFLLGQYWFPGIYGQPQSGAEFVVTPIVAVPPLVLETLTSPPYRFSWTPTRTGTYFISARSTDAGGGTYETVRAQVDVYAANDDFLAATVIEPSTVATNFAFDLHWTSAEPGEPPHRIGAAGKTVWWKWTPSYSGRVRLKAVRGQCGLPLEVFTGSAVEDLRLVAHNNGRVSLPGLSGVVRFRVQAGETYYLRVDNDPRVRPSLVMPFTYASPDTTLTLEPAGNPLPGEFNFSLIASLRPTAGEWPRVTTAYGRVFMPNGRPVADSNYRAQFYVGTSPATLQPVGTPQPFYDASVVSIQPSFAGLFVPTTIVVPDCRAGQRVFVQIRVWDSALGDASEITRAGGGMVGASRIVSVVAGSEETGPARLLGIGNITLRDPAR